MIIDEEINGYQNDDTREAKTCIEDSQSESASVP